MTVQVAEEPEPDSVHGFGLKVPVPLVFQATVPVGVAGVPGEVSVTVAVQTMPPLAFEQLTIVEVVRFTVMVEAALTGLAL